MPQFLVLAQDYRDPDAPNRRAATRPKHLALGDEMRARGELRYAVALLDEQERMIGSVMVVEYSSREELDAWLKREPYVTERVWDRIEVKPCRIGPSFQRP